MTKAADPKAIAVASLPMQPDPTPQWTSSRHFDAPIFITGLPRSGTSMVTGLLGASGLWLGATVPGGHENPRGFFENVLLREQVQKEILRRCNFDPLGVRRLPPRDWLPNIRNFRLVVTAALAAQQYDGGSPWGFKDPKTLLTWRIWNHHFPRARWIIVRRPSEEVIASCLRTSFMKRQSSDPLFWRDLVDAYLSRLDDLQQAVAWCRSIQASDIIDQRYEDLERLMIELDLAWRPDAVRAFVAPEHWHSPQDSPA